MSSILKKLFNNKKQARFLQLGRYSDNYKSKSNLTDWDLSLDLYTKNDYFGSVFRFLSYLNNDTQDNVIITEMSSQKIKFKIYQGSKCVYGFANEDGFFAEVRIVKCYELNRDLFKTLLEKNYNLQYTCFSLDSDDNICMNFYSDKTSASPYKLYYGLKELATTSDKHDDVLLKKFNGLSLINDGYLIQLQDEELKIKYNFLKNKIQLVNHHLMQYKDDLKSHTTLSYYLLLNNVFTLDYLLKPEGLLMEKIERIQFLGSTQNHHNNAAQLELILNEYKSIEMMQYEEVASEMYNTISSFGNLQPVEHSKLVEAIEQEMVHYNWYLSNGYKELALNIPSFVATSMLYKYALPLPDKLYLELLIRILQNDFFVANHFDSLLDEKLAIKRKSFLNELNNIETAIADQFSDAKIDFSKINYHNIYDFCSTFLEALSATNPKTK